MAPLASRNTRLEIAPAVAGALVDGGDTFGREFPYQVGQAVRTRLGDVPLDMEPPTLQIHSVGNPLQMPPNVKRTIGSESRLEVRSRGFQPNPTVGQQKEGRFLRL